MSTRLTLRMFMSLLLLGLLASVPAFAGSAVIGSVAGSLNATVGGQALMPNTVIFSGDSLQVKEGATVVALENGSRMAFGQNTSASFLREANQVTVLLEQGNVSVYHPDNRVGVEVKAGDVTVAPAPGFKSLGEVAMLNGAVVVTAKQGTLRVAGNGTTTDLAAGKTITITPKTARAPQTGGSQKLGGTDELLDVGALAAGAVAAVLAGVSISRANDARDAANAANSNAIAATAAANSAGAAASAAGATAAAAAANANAAGCALNNFNTETFGFGTQPSPYTPPAGFTCPPF